MLIHILVLELCGEQARQRSKGPCCWSTVVIFTQSNLIVSASVPVDSGGWGAWEGESNGPESKHPSAVLGKSGSGTRSENVYSSVFCRFVIKNGLPSQNRDGTLRMQKKGSFKWRNKPCHLQPCVGCDHWNSSCKKWHNQKSCFCWPGKKKNFSLVFLFPDVFKLSQFRSDPGADHPQMFRSRCFRPTTRHRLCTDVTQDSTAIPRCDHMPQKSLSLQMLMVNTCCEFIDKQNRKVDQKRKNQNVSTSYLAWVLTIDGEETGDKLKLGMFWFYCVDSGQQVPRVNRGTASGMKL